MLLGILLALLVASQVLAKSVTNQNKNTKQITIKSLEKPKTYALEQLPEKIEKVQQKAPEQLTEVGGASADLVKKSIIKWSNYYGADQTQMLRVASCESTLNPNASNGTHFGIFQFLPSTFYANVKYMDKSGYSYWNYDQNIEVATWMFVHGQANQWQCK